MLPENYTYIYFVPLITTFDKDTDIDEYYFRHTICQLDYITTSLYMTILYDM